MEISSVQNFYRMQNTQQVSRVKRSSEDSTTAAVSAQNYETDTVDLSADARLHVIDQYAAKAKASTMPV